MTDEKEIQNLKNNLIGFKGWWTRAVNSATPYANGTKKGSPEIFKGKIEDLFLAKRKVEDVVSKLQFAQSFPEGSQGLQDLEGVLTTLQDTFDGLMEGLSHNLAEAQRDASRPISSQPRFVKAVPELKPETLSFDTPPASLAAWIKGFEQYYSASNFDLCKTHSVAQGYLKRLLDDRLVAVLDTKIEENTPVVGNGPSCISALREVFEERFPIHSRRLTAFNLKQPAGVDFLDFYGSAAKTFSSADIRKMTPEDIEVFLLISATTDEELKREFFKLQKPNLSTLLATARVHQAMKVNQGKVSVVAAAGWDAKNHLLDLGYRCFRCASKSHGTDSCRTSRSDLFCELCRAVGHDKEVCVKHLPKP